MLSFSISEFMVKYDNNLYIIFLLKIWKKIIILAYGVILSKKDLLQKYERNIIRYLKSLYDDIFAQKIILMY